MHRRAALALASISEADERVVASETIGNIPPRRVLPAPIDIPMLISMGFAVENLLKGILAADVTNFIDDKGELAKRMKHHGLVTFYDASHPRRTARRTGLLQLLEAAVNGWGRYAIGVSPQKSVKVVYTDQQQTLVLFEELFRDAAVMMCKALWDGPTFGHVRQGVTTERTPEEYVAWEMAPDRSPPIVVAYPPPPEPWWGSR